MKVIILAGGSGSRLWPLSRDSYPKQFIKLNNSVHSLFQETFLRSVELVSSNEIYVVTNQKYKFLVMGEVDELGIAYNESNILVEPKGKNTLPAILAGIKESTKDNEDTIVVFPSDHKIEKENEFRDIIKKAEELSQSRIITFGVKPDFPNTGYGYIAYDSSVGCGFNVQKFKEKPDLELAKEYISKGYLWNSGIFMFNSDLFMSEVKSHMPDMYDIFSNYTSIDEAYSKIDTGISIDYGVLEKSSIIAVVESDIGWNDLGSFDSFYDVFDQDDKNNITWSENILIDSTNNLIQSDKNKLIAAVGIEDLIIVDNRDALLICKKNQSQKVKDVVEILKKKNDPRAELHVQDYRPWGNYKILEEEKGAFKIKRITVNQGKKLSYQLHYHRSEHWIVVKGTAKVVIDDEERIVQAGESIYMKAGQKHRLENPGKIPLEIIEVQMGDYLEEDDIIRFDDDFGRS